ncbi:MAG: universal stress protein [Candidatus Acidiferrales bacterium]|jgi:nucleotide-binding universal stress UspA family protein
MKILLAVDGSKFSDAAVQTVIEQARSQDTEVQVLHVVEPPSLLVAREMGGYDQALDAMWEAEIREAEVLVTNVAKELRSKGLQVTATVEQGDPKSKIIDTASKWRADMIVVGSHGRKGLEHFLLGSVSEAVAHHARCSVEIVRIPSKH